MGRIAVAAVVSLWVIPISITVNKIVSDPYMVFDYMLEWKLRDEIFHIPQAQRYCRGDFKTWDPMITTPPALVLVYDVLITLRPSLGERKATIYAIVMALYPVHWFFTFLYYTDMFSLTAVLAMYLASLKKQYWVGAMLGALATLSRQTNVIWMLFVAADGAIRFCEEFYPVDCVKSADDPTKLEEDHVLTDNKNTTTTSTLRRILGSSRST